MQPSLYAPRLRAERLVAAGRAALGASSLFAIWFDPAEPANYAGVAYSLLVAYVCYATVAAVALWRVGTIWKAWPFLTHALDLVFFSLFIVFTEGPASPFTTYFVFALVSATLRWQARGTLWTAGVAMAVFLAVGVSRALHQPTFELHAFIIRAAYMAVIAILLGYLGAHERQTLREMGQLAAWPPAVAPDVRTLTAELLAYARPLIDARQTLLVWAEPDTPWLHVAQCDREGCRHDRHALSSPVVAEWVARRPFVSTSTPTRRTIMHDVRMGTFVASREEPFQSDIAGDMGNTVVATPLAGHGFEGWLLCDKAEGTLDDLLLTEVVGGLISARLEAFFFAEQLRQSAAAEERVRLSRDLHDGVLQSLTGAALRLAAIRKLLRDDSAAAMDALAELQQVLATEQRDLRFFIQELRPQTLAIGRDRSLYDSLRDLADRMEREWDLHVDLSFDRRDGVIAEGVARHIYLLVREGLVNAARHGAASSARVQIAPAHPDALAVSIADNGHGFPFEGSFDTEELLRRGLGPRTLRERVQLLQGSLTLRSSPSGAELLIRIPGAALT